MPVFTRIKEDVLVLTADGDYTPGELARMSARAFDDHAAPPAALVLLDVSGAAGLESRSPEAMIAEGTALAAHRNRISKLAVVVSSRFNGLFDEGGAFVQTVGVDVGAFPSHAEAMDWLRGMT
ncbi:MAG: hypothetical protein WD995_06360 [Gemmatimonadota bacterium]